MNSVVLIGRLVRDPQIKEGSVKVAKYTLAVDRFGKEKQTDFISCVAFGKNAEFVETYLLKGAKIAVRGSIHTGSYEKQDGTKVYTTDVYIDGHEFVESRQDAGGAAQPKKKTGDFTPMAEEDFTPFF